MSFSITSIIKERVGQPARKLLTQGVSPERIALSIALGSAISICPLIGLPTILCTIVALAMRLNIPLIQSVNYLGTAPQWALIIPFLRMGETLFGSPHVPISIPHLKTSLETDFWSTAFGFWKSAGYATLAWLLITPFLVGIIYVLLLPMIRKLAQKRAQAGQIQM